VVGWMRIKNGDLLDGEIGVGVFGFDGGGFEDGGGFDEVW